MVRELSIPLARVASTRENLEILHARPRGVLAVPAEQAADYIATWGLAPANGAICMCRRR
jgi:hypothetical protein